MMLQYTYALIPLGWELWQKPFLMYSTIPTDALNSGVLPWYLCYISVITSMYLVWKVKFPIPDGWLKRKYKTGVQPKNPMAVSPIGKTVLFLHWHRPCGLQNWLPELWKKIYVLTVILILMHWSDISSMPVGTITSQKIRISKLTLCIFCKNWDTGSLLPWYRKCIIWKDPDFLKKRYAVWCILLSETKPVPRQCQRKLDLTVAPQPEALILPIPNVILLPGCTSMMNRNGMHCCFNSSLP